MANKSLFSNEVANRAPETDSINDAGGIAYSLDNKHSLCQYAVTGTFNNTYYSSNETQLEQVKELCKNVSSDMIAKIAIYSHKYSKMKDTPAYLLAVLSARKETNLVKKVFPQVITNIKMLLNFVQIIRSGETGRRSFGTAIKKLIQNWITSRTGEQLFIASIGYSKPSLVDVIKMVHPKPRNDEQNAVFGYLLKRNYDEKSLPKLIKDFEAFKQDNTNPLPDVPFRALTNCDLTIDHWCDIAKNMPWNTLRMNLNLLSRNNVFNNEEMVDYVSTKIRDPEQIKENNVFPYQLLTSYLNTFNDIPTKISMALQEAMEIATKNVPRLEGNIAVCIDLSGSMRTPVTGNRGSVSTSTSCMEVASLIASCILRNNKLSATIVGWASDAKIINLNPYDSVITNSKILMNTYVGNGTNAQLALKTLNDNNISCDSVIVVSDNQSWINPHKKQAGLTREWHIFKNRNKNARMVCINIQPYFNTQVPDNKDVMNIGGFNDQIFEVIKSFFENGNTNFVEIISGVEL